MNAVVDQPSAETTDKIHINPNVDPRIEMQDCTFRFKKDDLGNKRANVEGKIPVPSLQGFVDILEKGGKGFALLQEAAYNVVRGVAQEKVSNDEKITSLDQLNLAELSWEAIANMPKEDRRSSTIPDEQWNAFCKKYIEVMPALTGKSLEAITNHTKVYVKKFAQFKTDKETLGKLKTQLGIFMQQPGADDFQDVLELLTRRADNYLQADDVAALKANL